MAGGAENMTKAEALLNTFEALRFHRITHGAPPTILINCGDAVNIEIATGWSKSSINSKAQVAFLIIPASDGVTAILPKVKKIYWGESVFVVRGEIQPPKEEGGYWLLPVREA